MYQLLCVYDLYSASVYKDMISVFQWRFHNSLPIYSITEMIFLSVLFDRGNRAFYDITTIIPMQTENWHNEYFRCL